jgi:thiamine kinase-like enzyme
VTASPKLVIAPTSPAPDQDDSEDSDTPTDIAAVRAVLQYLPSWDNDAEISRVEGGLTNRSYRAADRTGDAVVVRLAGGKSELLSIDRRAECANARAAATTGVGPAVLFCDPDAGVSAVQWCDGRTLESKDLDDPRMLGRIAAACRTLHAGPRFACDFDMLAVQRKYLAVVLSRGFRLPPGYLDFAPQVEQIAAALAASPAPTLPCHNDLLAANIIDDGTRLWLIDYEYAGNNDPCFELGNIWSEAALERDRLEHLVTVYYGRARPERVARARLLALMSKYGWTLWAAIQDAVSEVHFDFWSWGMEKYERAVAEFNGPEFPQLISDVRQPA